MLVSSATWNNPGAEVKSLCGSILAKAIQEEDKYQVGLTKIFFRAGMLAFLESQRSDKLNAMVTLVQKNFRRRMAVKKFQQMKHACIRIQTWWRGIMAQRFVQKIRREVAAMRIQTACRMFVQRHKFNGIRNAVIKIQSRKSSPLLIILIMSEIHSLYRDSWSKCSSGVQGDPSPAWGNSLAESVPRIVSAHF